MECKDVVKPLRGGFRFSVFGSGVVLRQERQMLAQGRKLSALGWSLESTRSERAAGRGVAGEVARPDSVALSGHVPIQTGSQG
jgi:hypothetical protein